MLEAHHIQALADMAEVKQIDWKAYAALKKAIADSEKKALSDISTAKVIEYATKGMAKNNSHLSCRHPKSSPTREDLQLMADLTEYFFEEVPQRIFQMFLDDFGYSAEEFAATMSRLKTTINLK